MDGVQINLSNSIFPEDIFFNKSSEPITSAPLFFASLNLFSSHSTPILIFFPLPWGSSITLLKLESAVLIFFKFILKDRSIDSKNFAFALFLSVAIIALIVSIFLSLTDSINFLYLFFFYRKFHTSL